MAGGGTNALVVDHPDFTVDYHDGSYLDHLAIASDVRATVREVDSFRLADDVDIPADLVELLLYENGTAPMYLEELGFKLDTTTARTGLRRVESPSMQTNSVRSLVQDPKSSV